MTPTVLTVSQINRYIKSLFDGDLHLNHLYICGEISNFTNHYRTGHFYFTLKDGSSAIRAVMFRSNVQRIRFLPENGMHILARGRISVFERDGQYQLYIDDMQPDGLGSLNLALEQMKKKLEQEGLFDSAHKQPIPRFPARVGLITSPTGAAVHDIIQILGRRFPVAQIVFCPVQVQGEDAALQIAEAIKRFNRVNAADVLIVGRGGGSLEDLWAFNEETVARAVHDSHIPIISAVGHETDFTICDLAADLRAPTPSSAAELVAPDWREQADSIAALRAACTHTLQRHLQSERLRLRASDAALQQKNPLRLIETQRICLDEQFIRLMVGVGSPLQARKKQLSVLCGKLQALSPLQVLARGYSVTYAEHRIVKSSSEIKVGDCIHIFLADGELEGKISHIL